MAENKILEKNIELAKTMLQSEDGQNSLADNIVSYLTSSDGVLNKFFYFHDKGSRDIISPNQKQAREENIANYNFSEKFLNDNLFSKIASVTYDSEDDLLSGLEKDSSLNSITYLLTNKDFRYIKDSADLPSSYPASMLDTEGASFDLSTLNLSKIDSPYLYKIPAIMQLSMPNILQVLESYNKSSRIKTVFPNIYTTKYMTTIVKLSGTTEGEMTLATGTYNHPTVQQNIKYAFSDTCTITHATIFKSGYENERFNLSQMPDFTLQLSQWLYDYKVNDFLTYGMEDKGILGVLSAGSYSEFSIEDFLTDEFKHGIILHNGHALKVAIDVALFYLLNVPDNNNRYKVPYAIQMSPMVRNIMKSITFPITSSGTSTFGVNSIGDLNSPNIYAYLMSALNKMKDITIQSNSDVTIGSGMPIMELDLPFESNALIIETLDPSLPDYAPYQNSVFCSATREIPIAPFNPYFHNATIGYIKVFSGLNNVNFSKNRLKINFPLISNYLGDFIRTRLLNYDISNPNSKTFKATATGTTGASLPDINVENNDVYKETQSSNVDSKLVKNKDTKGKVKDTENVIK